MRLCTFYTGLDSPQIVFKLFLVEVILHIALIYAAFVKNVISNIILVTFS